MRWIGEQGDSVPDPLVMSSGTLSWRPVDSWIAHSLPPNGQLIALCLIVFSYTLPPEKSELLMDKFRELRAAGSLTLISPPGDWLMIYEASRAFREAARVHAPRISWRLFWPEKLPL